MANVIHHPHCNRNCTPAGHTFSIPERDHVHLAIMAAQCGRCIAQQAPFALRKRPT